MKGQLQELVDELNKDSESSRQHSAPPEHSTPEKKMRVNDTAFTTSPRAQVVQKLIYAVLSRTN